MRLTEGKYICINAKSEFDNFIKGDIYELKLSGTMWTIYTNSANARL
jgi:hypothetical protein